MRSIEVEALLKGGYTAYMVLTISTRTFESPAEGYLLLARCRDLMLKRLRHVGSWSSYLWRLEGGSSGDFPHLNLVFFGWSFLHRSRIKRMWGSVTREVTGVAATASRIASVGNGELGRLSRYTFKEALTGLASYTWKEGRPMWLPKGRRIWAKSKGSYVSAWPKRSRREARTLDAGGDAISSVDAARIAADGVMVGVRRLTGQGRDRSPPNPSQLLLAF